MNPLLALFLGYAVAAAIAPMVPAPRRGPSARRQAGPLLLALSLFALAIDARVLFGGLAESARTGFTSVHLLLGMVLVVPALLLYAPRLRCLGELYDYVTLGDFLGQRFQHGPLRGLVAALAAGALCLQITGHLGAVGCLAASMTGQALPPWAAILIVSLAAGSAASKGSLHGLMVSHLLQSAIIVAGGFVLLGLALHALPGPGALAAAAGAARLDPPSVPAAGAWIGSAILAALACSAQPQVVQHIFAARSDGALRRGLGGFSILALAVVPALLAACVWIGPRLFPEPGAVAPPLGWACPSLPGTLPPSPPVATLLAFVLLAGIVTTLDAALLALAELLCRECAAPLLRRDRQALSQPHHLAVAAWAAILPAAAVAARWALPPGILLELAAALFVQLLPCLWLGPYNRRLRGGPALAGMGLGALTALAFLIAGQPYALGLPAALVGLALNLALCWTGIATLGASTARRRAART